MRLEHHDPPAVPEARGGYTNALQVDGATRLLFISGQIPVDAAGDVPPDPERQCRRIWDNIVETLHSAGMGVTNLVQVRTYLSDRDLAAVNTAVRQEVLGDHRPALTVVVAEIFDRDWLLEIEATAAA